MILKELEEIQRRHDLGYTATLYGSRIMASNQMREDIDRLVDLSKHLVDHRRVLIDLFKAIDPKSRDMRDVLEEILRR